MNILIGYASAHGSTAEIAQFIGRILSAFDASVTVADVKHMESVDGYDAFVLGSAIEGGMWRQDMLLFMDRFRDVLAAKPTFLFITCIRVLEADGDAHARRYYVHPEYIDQLHIEDIAVFAGRLNIQKIDWNESWLLAAQYDGAVVPGRLNHDYRDWNAVALWALSLARQLAVAPAFESAEVAGAH